MGKHRTGYTWAPGTGWVRKAEETRYQYESLGEGWKLFMNAVRWFPDFLLDLCRDEGANYDLPMIHRMILRAEARNRYVDITGCRGMGKTHCTVGGSETLAITWPGSNILYSGPSMKQTAAIAGEAHGNYDHDYPILTKHFQTDSMGKGDFKISTPFGSEFFITPYRGMNLHSSVAEEIAQEEGVRFDEVTYRKVILNAVRNNYTVNGEESPTCILYRQHSITSAGRRQNFSYENRELHLTMMRQGQKAFVMDVPYDVILLNQMRPVDWVESRKQEMTPDEFARELCSLYTGTDTFPMVSDSTLTDCRSLLMMEDHSCLKDNANEYLPKDVIYVVGYDVSYADGPVNAKCACVVLKLTRQRSHIKRDKYLKQVVYVDDWRPTPDMDQARKVKAIWNRFCFDGADTYLAIDAWQFGSAVAACLMQDIGDGLPPMCSYNHEFQTSIELPGALPVLYPIKAGGLGVTDPDADMVRYAQTQFEYRNIQLLTSNWQSGLEAYKKYHRIKDDRSDSAIYNAYRKTGELVGQIQNLKVINGTEKRISQHIQRDSWSALKYALRVAQRLEWQNLVKRQTKSDYDDLLRKYQAASPASAGVVGTAHGRLITARQGGRVF